ncbi:outer membrane homotrimeric porin [Maridesulfovibrio sp.]|uniref:outer membrane homotrimeric porin n=1 Tax=Maridesulfovibrio sp. TaxID=2795000 RepID=UPI0029CA857F|nr:outer membrane homotrimeric porin [Maridesulfovibrio sp.]
MKKIAILAVLAAMVLGFAASASAVDLDAKGQFQFQMNIMDNTGSLIPNDKTTNNSNSEDDLNFWFRARTEFRFIANENLWAVLYTEYKNRLGDAHRNYSQTGPTALDAGANDEGLYVKRAYLQYRFPGTEVLTSAGIMSINLPGAAAGSMVLGDADLGTFQMEAPITDQIALAGAFVRVNDDSDGDVGTANTNNKDELDIFYAAAPITIDGLSATPYFAYSLIGKNTTAVAGLQGPAGNALNKDATAWWLGTTFTLDMFDPIVFNADIVYGAVDANQKRNDRSGLLFDASLAYTGLDFVQPKLVFAYTTGEDDKTDNGSERLPVVSNDWAFGTTYFGGSALTSADMDSNEQVGFWTIGLSLEKISFFDKLSHDIHVLYVQGTNDKDLVNSAAKYAAMTNITANGDFLTSEDHVFEVDFNTNYQIYDELAAIVEFGYVDVDLDKGVWEDGAGQNVDFDPSLKFAIGLVYKF